MIKIKKYILDTNSLINQLKLVDKNKKYDKDRYALELLEKVILYIQTSSKIENQNGILNINSKSIGLESYILIYDGVLNTTITHSIKLEELRNQLIESGVNSDFTDFIDIQFSGSIFSSNDVIKRYLRLNKLPSTLISDDFDLCSMSINNGNKFLRPEEFLLKLKFVGDKDFDISNELSNLSTEIRHSKSTVESETFNLLDYFKTNDLASNILENTIDGNVRKVPKFEELQKQGEFRKKIKPSVKSINEDVLNKLDYFESKDKPKIFEKQIENIDMSFKKQENTADKKSFSSLADLSNLLDTQKDKQSKREIKKENRKNENMATVSPYVKNNDATEKENNPNSADVDYFLNVFSK